MTSPLTADRLYATRGSPIALASGVATDTIVYEGGLIAENSGGYLVPAASTPGLRVRGMCSSTTDNSTGGNGAAIAPFDTDCIVSINNSATHACAQSDIGHPVWVEDDNHVCGGAGGSSVMAGILIDLSPDGTKASIWVSDSLGHATVVRAAPEAIAASGALSTTVGSTVSSAAGALALTLANGAFEGQQKWVFLKTAGHNAVITPATFADGATITLSAAAEFWIGEWHSDGWHNVATTGAIA